MNVLTVLMVVFLFCLLILSHEFGHFAVAKLLGVRVNEFSVGMGPLLFSRKKGETQYSLRLLPIGGYCMLQGEDAGEEGFESVKDDPASFVNQKPLAKIAILAAGSLMNILTAFIVLVILYFSLGYGPSVSVPAAFRAMGFFFEAVRDGLVQILGGQVGREDVVGVVGMVGFISAQAQYGMANVVFLLCMLSVNLGIMNLLPIPALDGGRILFVFIRWISGGRLSEKTEAYIHAAGMVLLIGLMIFLVINDSINLLS